LVEAVSFRVRPAVESDLKALEWEGQYARFRRVYRRAMEETRRNRRLILVAEAAGQVVGQIFAQYQSTHIDRWDRGHTGYLYALRVRPEYRNQGIGTRLIQEAEAGLMRRGLSRAVIAVGKDNGPALRLYERLGYTQFAEDPGLWSYVDDQGKVQHVFEPAFLLHRTLVGVIPTAN
jgi:ribosomal protein S18 acetylase RimI-like enzyme